MRLRGERFEAGNKKSLQVHAVSFVKNVAPQKSIRLDFTVEPQIAVRCTNPYTAVNKKEIFQCHNRICAHIVPVYYLRSINHLFF